MVESKNVAADVVVRADDEQPVVDGDIPYDKQFKNFGLCFSV